MPLPLPAKYIAGDGYLCVNLWSEEEMFVGAVLRLFGGGFNFI